MDKSELSARIKDISDKRYGGLVALSFCYRKNNKTYWDCMCDCGNTIIADANSLQQKTTISCGCSKIRDLCGLKFGKLTVKFFSHVRNYKAYWKCECSCGRKQTICRERLISGLAKTCTHCSRSKPRKILSGQITGHLLVKNWLIKNNRIYWECECDCGKTTSVRADHIKNNKILSCGCHKQALMEKTNLQKYKVRSVMQNVDIAKKNARSCKNSCEILHWKTNELLVCQAGWEKKIVEYFNTNKINFLWQHKVFDVIVDGKNLTYRPDFYLFSTKKWVEIKGYEYEMSMKKFEYFNKYVKPNSELWNKQKLSEMDIL